MVSAVGIQEINHSSVVLSFDCVVDEGVGSVILYIVDCFHLDQIVDFNVVPSGAK